MHPHWYLSLPEIQQEIQQRRLISHFLNSPQSAISLQLIFSDFRLSSHICFNSASPGFASPAVRRRQFWNGWWMVQGLRNFLNAESAGEYLPKALLFQMGMHWPYTPSRIFLLGLYSVCSTPFTVSCNFLIYLRRWVHGPTHTYPPTWISMQVPVHPSVIFSVRIEFEYPTESRKPELKVHPLNLLVDAFFANMPSSSTIFIEILPGCSMNARWGSMRASDDGTCRFSMS